MVLQIYVKQNFSLQCILKIWTKLIKLHLRFRYQQLVSNIQLYDHDRRESFVIYVVAALSEKVWVVFVVANL